MMESAIRFSQNSLPGHGDQRFLRVDVTGRSIRLCKISKTSRKAVRYETVHTSNKVPPFRAFDWHPVEESLIAVGQSGGEATLLNIAEGQQTSVSFSVRNQRLCNAVTLNSQNMIAVGLDRVRTDFCLNLWDYNHQLPAASSKAITKGYTEPLHKLAGGEPIASLKFMSGNPQLLAAGVKGQYVRLYDLREPYSNNGLQFATRCAHNLAVDTQDENYFASCYPISESMVCFWDKRMATRSNSVHSNYGAGQYDKQPEASLEVKTPVDGDATIWSLRFSKSQRGRLGVLSSDGNLRVLTMGKDFDPEHHQAIHSEDRSDFDAVSKNPQDVYLNDLQDANRKYLNINTGETEDLKILSFDFMTGITKSHQSRLIVVTGDGAIRTTSLMASPEPVDFSSTGYLCKGSTVCMLPTEQDDTTSTATTLNRLRRQAEPRNSLKQAFKHSKQSKTKDNKPTFDLRRMSSFANQSWNADLGFYEKNVPLEDLLFLLSAPRLKCEEGYLLSPSQNRTLNMDSHWTEAFWSWVERAERISKNGNMRQDNLDLSFVGVFSIWMEEISTGSLSSALASASVSAIVKRLVNRLNLPQRRGCQTEYPWHRKLCLHVSGVGWGHEELLNMVQKLVRNNEHTKAAAMAIFADEEKLAYTALRGKTATQNHKMLAMAIAGAKARNKRGAKDSPMTNSDSDQDTEAEDDWQESIASLSKDLIDPYARAIFAYVRSGNWTDVVNEDSLPLKHRVGVALRHLSDFELTEFVGRITAEVIANGDIEGIILTGTGTREGLELLLQVTRVFGDLQTTILGLAVGSAGSRSLSSGSNNAEDHGAARKLEALKEAYRTSIMSWGLKFHRVKFDVAYSRALITSTSGQSNPLPKKKEQVRLVCNYCSSSIAQFNTSSDSTNKNNNPHSGGSKMIDTAKNILTPEKAAVLGTVCPKCGRHLPNCGVCDLWLGMPDETYAKWYSSQKADTTTVVGRGNDHQNTSGARNTTSSSVDMGASMTSSAITTIGPPASTTSSNNTTKTTTTNTNQPELKRKTSTDQNHHHHHPTTKSDTNNAQMEDENENENKSTTIHHSTTINEIERNQKWQEVMHKFTIFCVNCAHGFHAAHARMWFDGVDGRGGGHRVCPVPGCGCFCNG